MAKHGIFADSVGSGVSSPIVAETGIPFVIGSAPVQSAAHPAAVGLPVLCENFADFVDKLGYSDDWEKYTLCEFAYSHFKLYGRQPIIVVNVLDTATMAEAVAAADIDVVSHQVSLPHDAISDSNLIVKAAGGQGNALVKGSDYDVFYTDAACVIELLSASSAYDATALNVAYKKATPTAVNASAVATGIEAIESCVTRIGIVPDLICAPGFSNDAAVAAVMSTKAAGINGMFKAKALIDIDANSAAAAIAAKASNNFGDANEIACWPMVALSGKKYHMSTHISGLIAKLDAGNDDCPYESPSNKAMQCDALILSDGTEVNQTLAQANTLNASGIVTGLNFMGGMVAWGNYTAAHPGSTDPKDVFIPVSRMFDFVSNTMIKTFWGKLDAPMNRRLIDTIIDQANIWLNGLVGSGYLHGARVEFLEDENPLANLLAGVMKLHIYLAPPSPAQEIDFVLEYDAEYVTSALQA